MRVLIYGDCAETLAEKRQAGHHASLRSPDETYFNEKEPEPCDEVVCWSMHIAHAYTDKAVIDYRGVKITEAQAIEMNEDAKPKKTKKNHGQERTKA